MTHKVVVIYLGKFNVMINFQRGNINKQEIYVFYKIYCDSQLLLVFEIPLDT